MEILLTLLERHGNVDVAAHHRMTPLHVAAWHGNKEIISVLVEKGTILVFPLLCVS